MKTRIATAASVASLLFASFTTMAYADVSTDQSGNGSFSHNSTTVSTNTSNHVNQTNNASISNNVSNVSNTGGNSTNDNTGGSVMVNTGNSDSTTAIRNAANINHAMMGSSSSDSISANELGNGSSSNNRTNIKTNNNSSLNQTNRANITNNVTNNSTTGNNHANGNTSWDAGYGMGDPSIITGNSISNTMINNAANANFAIGGGGNGGSEGSQSIDTAQKGNGSWSQNQLMLMFQTTIA